MSEKVVLPLRYRDPNIMHLPLFAVNRCISTISLWNWNCISPLSLSDDIFSVLGVALWFYLVSKYSLLFFYYTICVSNLCSCPKFVNYSKFPHRWTSFKESGIIKCLFWSIDTLIIKKVCVKLNFNASLIIVQQCCYLPWYKHPLNCLGVIML